MYPDGVLRAGRIMRVFIPKENFKGAERRPEALRQWFGILPINRRYFAPKERAHPSEPIGLLISVLDKTNLLSTSDN